MHGQSLNLVLDRLIHQAFQYTPLQGRQLRLRSVERVRSSGVRLLHLSLRVYACYI